MGIIRNIGIINLVLGVIILLIPEKLYTFLLYRLPDSSMPPVGYTFMFLPALVILINGAAIIYFSSGMGGAKGLERISEAKQALGVSDKKEFGPTPAAAKVDSTPAYKTRHELIGLEVYDNRGEFYGKVKSVTLDNQGDVFEFLTERMGTRTIHMYSDLDTVGNVIMINHHD